jgi:hypothetical protein
VIPSIFHIDYLSLWIDNATPANVPTNRKYPFLIALVLDGVSSDDDMLRNIFSLNFMEHDITNAQKFPELARKKYLHTRSV